MKTRLQVALGWLLAHLFPGHAAMIAYDRGRVDGTRATARRWAEVCPDPSTVAHAALWQRKAEAEFEARWGSDPLPGDARDGLKSCR